MNISLAQWASYAPFLGRMRLGGIVAVWLAACLSAQAGFPQVVCRFPVGACGPYGDLRLSSDGSFYGTTSAGGSSDQGTIFRLTPAGVMTTLTSFSGANGSTPHAGLIWGADGALFGTTYAGGASGLGTVFRVTTNGSLSVVASFDGERGRNPESGLILGADGAFYGTAYSGAARTWAPSFALRLPGS